jgi:tubulin polyglutamylase TTLL6/13
MDDCDESPVAQQYISPYLIDDYKFDLRIFILIISVDPLRIYIHEEEMTRFCIEKSQTPRSPI